jgi:hypothetical protein
LPSSQQFYFAKARISRLLDKYENVVDLVPNVSIWRRIATDPLFCEYLGRCLSFFVRTGVRLTITANVMSGTPEKTPENVCPTDPPLPNKMPDSRNGQDWSVLLKVLLVPPKISPVSRKFSVTNTKLPDSVPRKLPKISVAYKCT